MIIDINLFRTLFGLEEGKIIDINLFNTLFGLVDCLIWTVKAIRCDHLF